MRNRVSASSSVNKNTNDNDLTQNTLVAYYSQWDSYEDIEELQEQINVTKKDLVKLNNKITTPTPPQPISSVATDIHVHVQVINVPMVQFKEEGNTLFKQHNYKEALALYEKIYFEYCFDGSQDDRKQADSIRVLCLLNAAACFLRLKLYSKCIEYCTDAIQVDEVIPRLVLDEQELVV